MDDILLDQRNVPGSIVFPLERG